MLTCHPSTQSHPEQGLLEATVHAAKDGDWLTGDVAEELLVAPRAEFRNLSRLDEQCAQQRQCDSDAHPMILTSRRRRHRGHFRHTQYGEREAGESDDIHPDHPGQPAIGKNVTGGAVEIVSSKSSSVVDMSWTYKRMASHVHISTAVKPRIETRRKLRRRTGVLPTRSMSNWSVAVPTLSDPPLTSLNSTEPNSFDMLAVWARNRVLDE